MSQVYLEIEDLDSLILFIREAREKTGLLRDILPSEVRRQMADKEFPIRVPVNLDSVIKVASNPMLRKIFGKKMEETTKKCLREAIGV